MKSLNVSEMSNVCGGNWFDGFCIGLGASTGIIAAFSIPTGGSAAVVAGICGVACAGYAAYQLY
ncbi:MAG: hypothetical protein MJ211_05125 [Bacteroidales bacterium]|nr:hypothetical protein [Bacteroidales bacterium]